MRLIKQSCRGSPLKMAAHHCPILLLGTAVAVIIFCILPACTAKNQQPYIPPSNFVNYNYQALLSLEMTLCMAATMALIILLNVLIEDLLPQCCALFGLATAGSNRAFPLVFGGGRGKRRSRTYTRSPQSSLRSSARRSRRRRRRRSRKKRRKSKKRRSGRRSGGGSTQTGTCKTKESRQAKKLKTKTGKTGWKTGRSSLAVIKTKTKTRPYSSVKTKPSSGAVKQSRPSPARKTTRSYTVRN